MSKVHFFQYYYLLTPVFFIADFLWDQSFRVAGLNDPVYRYYYYGFCLVCAAVCYLLPRLSSLVTLFESCINMTLLVLGIMLPIINAGNTLEADGSEIGLSVQKLLNFIFVGSLICYSFYNSLADLKEEK